MHKVRKYLLGFLKFFTNKRISWLSVIDYQSTIDKYASVKRFAKVLHSTVGAYTYIGRNTEVVHASIGKFCSISYGCHIGLAKHTLSNLATSSLFTSTRNATGSSWVNKNLVEEYDEVHIGNDVWIGFGVTIVGNVRIGDGAVLATGSVVTKDVPPYAIVGGVPAKLIRYRFSKEIINELLEIKWWNYPPETIRSNASVFQKESFDEVTLLDLKSKFNRSN